MAVCCDGHRKLTKRPRSENAPIVNLQTGRGHRRGVDAVHVAIRLRVDAGGARL